MKTYLLLIGVVLLIALSLPACGSQPRAAAQSNEPTASQGGSVIDYDSLMAALRSAGAEVEPGEELSQAFFSVTGNFIKVNGQDIQVFEYEDAEAMKADASQVDPEGGSIGTTMVTWVSTPHFYKTGKIIVLYVGDEADVLGLLEGALGPQFAGR
jgi:hypothetical protein